MCLTYYLGKKYYNSIQNILGEITEELGTKHDQVNYNDYYDSYCVLKSNDKTQKKLEEIIHNCQNRLVYDVHQRSTGA